VTARRRPPGASTPGRALVAGGIGNVVEWYDFAVYGAFVPIIASTYFPGDDPIASLSASFAVFAPVLLVALRSVQGLSVGGEAAGASAFVVEYAPDGRRGWYGSWLWSTLALGVAGGIGMAVVTARVFPRDLLENRAWRLAFLLALPLGLVGWYLRLRLDDTPRFLAMRRADAVVRRPVAETLRNHRGRLLLGLAPVAAASLAFNLFFIYLPAARGVPLSMTLAAALVGLLLMAVTAPILGSLSDRVGRRPHLVAGTIALLLAVLPAFLLIRRAGPVLPTIGYLLIALPLSCLVVLPAFLAELFPTRSAPPPWRSPMAWGARCSAAPRRCWPRGWSGGPATRSCRPSTPPPWPRRRWPRP
jgi:MHS family proline/betaine transporter-like MFS transporter